MEELAMQDMFLYLRTKLALSTKLRHSANYTKSRCD
jgi:hypothetical protein